MLKKRISPLVCLLLCLLWALPVSGASELPYLTDHADLLTVSQEQTLTAQAKEASQRLGISVVMYVYSSRYETDNFIGEDFLRLYGMDDSEDLILLVVKKETVNSANPRYYYDLYLYGEGERQIATDEVDPLLDDANVYRNLKSGKINEGLQGFLNATETLASNTNTRPNPYLKALWWSLPVSLLAAFLACVAVKVSYSMKRRSVDYPLDRYARLELTEQEDLFVGKHVTRRTISSNSGGGGGGSRGGGRGHAGGR